MLAPFWFFPLQSAMTEDSGYWEQTASFKGTRLAYCAPESGQRRHEAPPQPHQQQRRCWGQAASRLEDGAVCLLLVLPVAFHAPAPPTPVRLHSSDPAGCMPFSSVSPSIYSFSVPFSSVSALLNSVSPLSSPEPVPSVSVSSSIPFFIYSFSQPVPEIVLMPKPELEPVPKPVSQLAPVVVPVNQSASDVVPLDSLPKLVFQ